MNLTDKLIPSLLFIGALLVTQAVRAEKPLGKFRNTWYYLVSEEEFPNAPKDTVILSMRDEVLAHVSQPFKKSLDIQGSGILSDGRVVNYAGRKTNIPGQKVRYVFTEKPFGAGVGGCALEPFHSIAVDPRRIPLGSLVRIEETVGLKLPDGSTHNGLWRAEDIGDAIQSDRIDLFVGPRFSSGKMLEQQGITTLRPLTVVLLKDPPTPSCVDEPLR